MDAGAAAFFALRKRTAGPARPGFPSEDLCKENNTLEAFYRISMTFTYGNTGKTCGLPNNQAVNLKHVKWGTWNYL